MVPEGDLITIGLDATDDRILPLIRANPLVSAAEINNSVLTLSAKEGSRVLPALVTFIEQYSLPMNSISIHSSSLEDIFIYLTGSALSADSGDAGSVKGGRRFP